MARTRERPSGVARNAIRSGCSRWLAIRRRSSTASGREAAGGVGREEAEEGLFAALDAPEEPLRSRHDAGERVGLQEGSPLRLARVPQAFEGQVEVLDEQQEGPVSELVDQGRLQGPEDLGGRLIQEVIEPVWGNSAGYSSASKLIDPLEQLNERGDRLVLEEPGDPHAIRERGSCAMRWCNRAIRWVLPIPRGPISRI